MDYKHFDMVHEITGRVIEINEKLDTVIFPIIRRIVSKTPEAADYIPEIINTCKKHYNSPLAKAIYTGEERYMKYLYDVVLPKWSSYHRDREHKDYDDYKKSYVR